MGAQLPLSVKCLSERVLRTAWKPSRIASDHRSAAFHCTDHAGRTRYVHLDGGNSSLGVQHFFAPRASHW